MNLFLKKVGLSLAILLVLLPLSASDLFTIGDGDVGSFRLYDSQGNKREVTETVVSQIGEGWIINNPETPILIETPVGTINLFEDAILVTGDLSLESPRLYLVRGKATFSTNEAFEGSLIIATPVSQFKLQGKGEIFVISTDDEESVTSFGGTVTASNGISHATTLVKPFGKLRMNDPLHSVNEIQDGYYLTYATYPDLMLAKQLVSDISPVAIAPTPRKPKVSVVALQVPDKPTEPGITIMPVSISAPSAFTNTTEIGSVPAPHIISVVTKQQAVPKTPSKINTTLVPVAPKRIIVTIRPVSPQNVKTVTTEELETGNEATAQVIVPPAPVLKTSTQVEAPLAKVEQVVAVEKAVAAEPQPSTEVVPQKVSKMPVILSTTEDKPFLGSVGLKTIYDYTYDGTSGNTQSHSITFIPYFSYKTFTLELHGDVATTDFSTYTSNVQNNASGSLETVAYVASYIEKFRFGYTSSPFYLALDTIYHNDSDFSNLTVPAFGDSDKLGLYSKITLSRISLITTFDDLNMDRLLADKPQYGSITLLYSGSENYPFQMSFGSLVAVATDPVLSFDLYPTLSFKFPVINKRNIQMGILVNASSYLPAYPTFDITELFDSTDPTIFPNYLANAGFTLHAGQFFAESLISIEKGKNQSLMINDFTYGSISTENDSDFTIFANLGFKSDTFSAELLWNVPFTSAFTIATLSSDASRKADLSQISLSFDQKNFGISLGIQQIGIIDSLGNLFDGSSDILSLFGGKYASSFLQASFRLGFAELKAKALYPIGTTSYTVPKVTLSATIDIGKKF
ncbi:hypothetical protein SpiGrapes_0134 [Sphaerochaeta pleomorpha str. Grapes]|uniref:FecR protein domain-containing protein n=1 Tax=Sphaerochaeta pleomorpha (strain ATCC BAA-1885 / DSM 22778 / Grapes) TaxID=158190 RepID=G8QTN3_SPHPG|nr:hypothetical protein [Sphaerochaeta pleomorpha]AEV27998.1 hypothetical protein SpiGrapes_0134 [Sphaerochaeta pleomorpha str. Grapes]